MYYKNIQVPHGPALYGGIEKIEEVFENTLAYL